MSIKVSLFERLIESTTTIVPCHVLEEQRIMRPEISALTREHYADIVDIQDNKCTLVQRIGDVFMKTNQKPDTSDRQKFELCQNIWSDRGDRVPGVLPQVFFWALQNNKESRPIAGLSACNEGEAVAVVALVRWHLACGVPPSAISVITPYKGQTRLIVRKLRTVSGALAPFTRGGRGSDRGRGRGRSRGRGWGRSFAPAGTVANNVLVSTVDRYQGNENDIVILSLVRARPGNRFVALQNRFIVAASRARIGFYIVGSPSAGPSHWRSFVSQLQTSAASGDSSGSDSSDDSGGGARAAPGVNIRVDTAHSGFVGSGRAGGDTHNVGEIKPTAASEAEQLQQARDYEREKITTLDVTKKVTHWFVIEASWLERWRMFVAGSPRRPGKIDNSTLVEVDRTGKYAARPGLLKAKDYRAVNHRVWSFFQDRFGGGPTIVRTRVDIYAAEMSVHQAVLDDGAADGGASAGDGGVADPMAAEPRIGPQIPICCPRHRQSRLDTISADALAKVPQRWSSLCAVQCTHLRDWCGHPCALPCHDVSSTDHSPQDKCRHSLYRPCTDHRDVTLRCGQLFKRAGASSLALALDQFECEVSVTYQRPECEHKVTLPCHESKAIEAGTKTLSDCSEPVDDYFHPVCNHKTSKPTCHQRNQWEQNPPMCTKKVKHTKSCGCSSTMKCFEQQNERREPTPCDQFVDTKRPRCPHVLSTRCHQAAALHAAWEIEAAKVGGNAVADSGDGVIVEHGIRYGHSGTTLTADVGQDL